MSLPLHACMSPEGPGRPKQCCCMSTDDEPPLPTGYQYDAAVMITASHLPYNRNGFKFFTKEGGYEKKDITELLALAAEEHAAEDAPNTAADARYRDNAFVLSCALHSEPGLIEQASSQLAAQMHAIESAFTERRDGLPKASHASLRFESSE